MFYTYFKTLMRHLSRNKVFALINIAGLSIGISAALVIFLIVQYDFTFDKQHKDAGRIYRVVSIFNFSGQEYKNPGAEFPLVNALAKGGTGIEQAAPLTLWSENQKLEIPVSDQRQRKVFKKPKPVFVDENYFKMFAYDWIEGNPSVSLQEPYQVVLTEKAASTYFPGLRPGEIKGKQIVFDDSVKTTVSGIVRELKDNSDLTFQVFLSRITEEQTTLKPESWSSWDNTTGNAQLFVKLDAHADPARVAKQAETLLNKNKTQAPGDKSSQAIWLQPLGDLHFNADFGAYSDRVANRGTLYGLITVAIFLLLLGCINFINLTTAQSSQRAKEIGIRKTMGSSKKQLILQFLSETFFLTAIATILSVALAPLLLKIFSDFIPPELHFDLLHRPSMILFLVVMVALISLLAGFYPAWVLSAFKPVNVLKNQSVVAQGASRNAWIRRSLTVSQFIIAQFLILATIAVGDQIRYSLHKDLGFRKDAIVYFDINYRDTVRTHKQLLLDKLRSIPEIGSVGLSAGTPSSDNSWSSTIGYKGAKGETTTDVELKFADADYLDQFGLKLVAGNNIETSDTVKAFLINETYAHILGFQRPQDAVGKYLTWSNKSYRVAGVLADFYYQSLRKKIRPLALGSWQKIERVFAVSLQRRNADGSNWKTALAKMEAVWKSIYPEEDFQYTFLDEKVAEFYKADQRISGLLRWATGLAILISCLGLLGLVTYTTHLRTKEIGVRKVLGASVSNIVTLLSKDFIFLVLAAFIVASPIAWWAVHRWLEDFAYRTTLNIWMFIGAGLLSVFIALVTISFQTFRAAAANPVRSLRTE